MTTVDEFNLLLNIIENKEQRLGRELGLFKAYYIKIHPSIFYPSIEYLLIHVDQITIFNGPRCFLWDKDMRGCIIQMLEWIISIAASNINFDDVIYTGNVEGTNESLTVGHERLHRKSTI